MEQEVIEALVGGAAIGGFLVILITILILLSIGIYIYFALTWMIVARKLKYKRAWLAWIPFANIAMILQLGGFHWAWVFLFLVPFAGWIAVFVLTIIATWKIFEKRKYPGWLSLSLLIPGVGMLLYGIVMGFVAWKDNPKKMRV